MPQQNEQPAQWCALIDIDGVLCENLLRREFGTDKDYEIFGRKCGNAVPRMQTISFVQHLKTERVAVFILTARSEKLRAVTSKWLAEQNVPFDELLMRPLGNRQADHVLKKEMLTDLKRRYKIDQPGGLEIVLAVDDDPKVVQMYRDNALSACTPEDNQEAVL